MESATTNGGISPSDVISAVAAAIALVALFVSIAEIRANRPRLRVRHYIAFGVGGLEGNWLVVSAINWGRQPTTVTSVSVEFPALRGPGGAKHTPHILQHVNGAPLGDQAPHYLEVGREAKFYFRYEQAMSDDPETLPSLCKKYGGAAVVSTSWQEKPVRRMMFKPS